MVLVSLILLWFPAVFMVGLTLMLHQFPPHASNTICGHRTRQNMASTEAWNHAQAQSFQITTDWTMWMVIWTPLAQWTWRGESAHLVMSGLLTLGVRRPKIGAFACADQGLASTWLKPGKECRIPPPFA